MTIDTFLRNASGSDKQAPFSYLIRSYFGRHPSWQDADVLRKIGDVRNAIVHEKTEAYGYAAIPTTELANRLRICRDRLTKPELAIPKFQKAVKRVSTDDTLEKVLRLIKDRDYSQFPVYEGDHFRGLLTENGITRWLANHVITENSLVELEDVIVKQVISNDEKRRNYSFVPRNIRVDDLAGHFAPQKLVEAVLITANGKQPEELMGIVTRWDIVHAT